MFTTNVHWSSLNKCILQDKPLCLKWSFKAPSPLCVCMTQSLRVFSQKVTKRWRGRWAADMQDGNAWLAVNLKRNKKQLLAFFPLLLPYFFFKQTSPAVNIKMHCMPGYYFSLTEFSCWNCPFFILPLKFWAWLKRSGSSSRSSKL